MSKKIQAVITDELYDNIKNTAEENCRTISQEVLYRLTRTQNITPPVFIAPDPTYTPPTPRPDPFPEHPYKIICDIKEPITSTPTASPSLSEQPTTRKNFKETLGTAVAEAYIPNEDGRDPEPMTFSFYLQDGCVMYDYVPNQYIRWNDISRLQEDIKTFLKEKLKMEYPYPPILSSREKYICDFIKNNFPKNKVPDYVLEDAACQWDTPEMSAYPASKELIKSLLQDAKFTYRTIGMECDYIKDKYKQIYR